MRQVILNLICSFLFVGCFGSYRDHDYLRQAEELTRQEHFEQAIEIYRKHIAYRLSVEGRPEWENPHFYLLIIGDLELRRGEPERALSYYQEAEQRGVEPGLVSDRYRSLGAWYAAHQRFNEALSHLSRFRDRDPLLFDAVLDRVAKEMTHLEESGQLPSPVPDAADLPAVHSTPTPLWSPAPSPRPRRPLEIE